MLTDILLRLLGHKKQHGTPSPVLQCLLGKRGDREGRNELGGNTDGT